MKWDKIIKKYNSYCRYHGYKKDYYSLLWFFHQNYGATREGDKYFAYYRNKFYPINELLEIFINRRTK